MSYRHTMFLMETKGRKDLPQCIIPSIQLPSQLVKLVKEVSFQSISYFVPGSSVPDDDTFLILL